ncbi:MAG: dTDP-4-dehydrorhamnose reductase [Thermoprotei archaeon]|nr:dTDP-4-dehydrorhamnose reductase [Thermoprotei archaeon]
MRILVTGGTGLLGCWLLKVFLESGHDVYATYHVKSPLYLNNVQWVRLDLEDFDNIVKALKNVKPHVVVHTAAYTEVDGCEANKDRAYKVNYLATKAIAEVSRDIDATLIYISTDYVFNGEKGNYSEDDIPNPINFYGLTKLLGEVAVESIIPRERYLIMRVSGLYGYSPTGKRNFGLVALEKLLRGEEVTAFYDQWLSPTYVPFLARVIAGTVNRGITGILHVAGERMSRYEFALKLANIVGRSPSLVKPGSLNEARLKARRPRDSSLNTEKARKLGLTIPPLEYALKDFVNTYMEAVRGV